MGCEIIAPENGKYHEDSGDLWQRPVNQADFVIDPQTMKLSSSIKLRFSSIFILHLSFSLIAHPAHAEKINSIESPTQGRDFYQVELPVSEGLSTTLTISGPTGFMSPSVESYPTMIVSAGFFTGPKSLELIPDPRNFILINIPYSITTETLAKDPRKLAGFVQESPAVMEASYLWIQNNPYFKIKKLAVMGVSLGTLMSPVALASAEAKGFKPDATIYLYGGSEFRTPFLSLAKRNQMNPFLAHNLANLVEAISAPVNPKKFLPQLTGPFLVINGSEDQIFSKETSQEQFDLLNGEKERHFVQGPHIDSDQPELIAQSLAIVMDYLLRMGF